MTMNDAKQMTGAAQMTTNDAQQMTINDSAFAEK